MVTNRMDLKRTLGPALAELRKRSGKSGHQVAREIGRSQPIVSRYESGRRIPSTTMLFKYLAAVNASLSDLDEAIQIQKQAPTPGRAEVTAAQACLCDDDSSESSPVKARIQPSE